MRYWHAALLLIFTAGISLAQTPAASNKECSQAQVLTIKGKWTAGFPTSVRPLNKADCLVAHEVVNLAPDGDSGEITVIYHSADIPPHTIKCGSRPECNNAYQVEDVSSKPTAVWWQTLSRFLQRQRSRQVPGILRGSLVLQPEVLCRKEGKIDFGPVWSLGSQPKPEFDKVVLTPLEAQVYVNANGSIDSSQSWNADFNRNNPFATRGKPMAYQRGRSALYQLETVNADGDISGRTIVLVASQSLCTSLSASYHLAVNDTLTWSADTPADAIFSFRLSYLESLVSKTP